MIGAFSSPWAVVLASLAAVNAVIALVYYARVVKTAFMDDVPAAIDQAAPTEVSPSLRLAMVLTGAVVLVTGFLPQIIAFLGDASRTIAQF